MPVVSYYCKLGRHRLCHSLQCQCPHHSRGGPSVPPSEEPPRSSHAQRGEDPPSQPRGSPLSRLKLQHPEWIINWSPGGYSTITARHLVTSRVLTAYSIEELRSLLEEQPP